MKRLRTGRFLAEDVRLVKRFAPDPTPLAIGDRVRLNSGGPAGLVVDLLTEDRVLVAWRSGLELRLYRVCLRRAEP